MSALAAGMLMTACVQFPELDSAVAPEDIGRAPPQLVPLASILEQSGTSTIGTAGGAPDISALTARLDILRAVRPGCEGRSSMRAAAPECCVQFGDRHRRGAPSEAER